MKVISRQGNSHDCIVCGLDNELGLKAPFYLMEDNSVISIFKYSSVHQSYPGRAHGGLISAMLDEIIGRAMWAYEPEMWGVTMSLNIKFRRPTPLDTELKAIGRITFNSGRTFEGEGILSDLEGNVLATAQATYLKMPLKDICDGHDDINVYLPCDREEI